MLESIYKKKTRKIDPIRLWRLISKRHIPHVTAESFGLGVLLATVGGYLDAYTYISRNGVFANAQTGNLVLLGIKTAQKQWAEGLIHLPPILAFIAGVLVTETFKNPRMVHILPNPERTILFLEILVLTIIGALPGEVPNVIVTVIISFVASVQFSTFRKLVKWTYNTATVTGNLRTATQAAYTSIFNHNQEAAKQSGKFFGILLSFLAGGFLGTVITTYFGVKAIWGASIILFIALLVLHPIQKQS